MFPSLRRFSTLWWAVCLLTCCSLSSKANAATYTVTNTNDSGTGSLRAAITYANANSGTRITFRIPGASGGPRVIRPLSELPWITASNTIIGGSTQTAYIDCNPNGPDILLDDENSNGGNGIPAPMGVLTFDGTSDCEVEGLVINNTGQSCITFYRGARHRVRGCYLGTSADGRSVSRHSYSGYGMSYGVYLSSSNDSIIGGVTPADRNVMCGAGHTARSGSYFSSSAAVKAQGNNNRIIGNYFGLNALGTASLGNYMGVVLDGADNIIGGSESGASNYFAGSFTGVHIQPSNSLIVSDRNIMQGNFFGFDGTGVQAIGTQKFGIQIWGSRYCQIGGSLQGQRNYFAGHTAAINLAADDNYDRSGQTFASVIGNSIGLNVNQKFAGTNTVGIMIASNNNTIGTASSGYGNTLAGCNVGISVGNVGLSDGSTLNSQGNSIRGNLIGFPQPGVTQNIGINLLGNDSQPYGVTLNDTGDGDSGPNGLQNFPVLTSATIIGNTVQFKGTINSKPNLTYRVDFFASAAAHSSGYGPGEFYVGSRLFTTVSSGNYNFTLSYPYTSALRVFSAIATSPSGDSSEFSASVRATVDTAPTLTSVTLTPNKPLTNQTLVASWSGSDTQGRTLTPTYVWKKNDVILSGQSSNQLNLATTGLGDRGDNISVEVVLKNSAGIGSNTVIAQTTVANTAPVISGLNANIPNNKVFTGHLSGSDADNDTLTFQKGTPPHTGSFTVTAGGTVYYAPPDGYVGPVSFTVYAIDNNGGQSETVTVNLNVSHPNKPPVFANKTVTLFFDKPANIQLEATDPEAQALTYELVSGLLPNGLKLSPAGLISGTPTGVTSDAGVPLQIKVSDGQLSTTATITLRVVIPLTISLSAPSPALYEGSYTVVFVNLNQPAPTGGLVLNLSSSNTAMANVPGQITIPAGQTQVHFNVTAPINSALGRVTIRAYNESASGSTELQLTPTLPNTTIYNPENGMTYTEVRKANGTATVIDGRTISRVDLILYRLPKTTGTSGDYWNGASWVSNPTALRATGTRNWTIDLPALENGDYVLTGTATDNANRTSVEDRREFRIEVPTTISVNDITINEGTAAKGTTGNTIGNFTVSLNYPATKTVSVNYVTSTTSATTALAGLDYVHDSGTLTFTPGQISKTVNVTVLGDKLAEANETFNLKLSNPVNATFTDDTGVATILDDDSKISASIADARVIEGNSGTTDANFTVTLSRAVGRTVTLKYVAAKGTATLGSDFNAATGTLTFAPGETTKTIAVQVRGDLMDEPDEKFTVKISGSGITMTRPTATGTIVDDDASPSISVENASLVEGHSGKKTMLFTLRLSAPSSQKVTVKAQTTSASTTPATARLDYTALALKVFTFNPGVTTLTVPVTIIGDKLVEGNEKFNLVLSSPVGATLEQAIVEGTIIDDDTPNTPSDILPALSINSVSLSEGNNGTKKAIFTVQLSEPSQNIVTVDFDTVDITATAASDYQTKRSSLTFAAGETTKTIEILVYGDTLRESDEQFKVVLSNSYLATIEKGTGIATITNDDTGSSVKRF